MEVEARDARLVKMKAQHARDMDAAKEQLSLSVSKASGLEKKLSELSIALQKVGR
jgi:hypothetical protein